MFISPPFDLATSISSIWVIVFPPPRMLRALVLVPLCQPKSSPNLGTAALSEPSPYSLWGQTPLHKGAVSHVAASLVAEARKGLGKRMRQTQLKRSRSCMKSVTLTAL